MLVYFLMIKLQGESSQMAGPAQGRPDRPKYLGKCMGSKRRQFHWGLGDFWEMCLTWVASSIAGRFGREGGRYRKDCCC